MAKTRLTKKDLPFLKDTLELSPEVSKRIQALQNRHKAKFDRLVSSSRGAALERYEKKLEALTKAKSEATKRFNAEIQIVREVITNLKKEKKEDDIVIGDIKAGELKGSLKATPASRKKAPTARKPTRRTVRGRKKGDKK